MESRRLVVWISAGILGFQGATLAFDLLNCTVLSWLFVQRHGFALMQPGQPEQPLSPPEQAQAPPAGAEGRDPFAPLSALDGSAPEGVAAGGQQQPVPAPATAQAPATPQPAAPQALQAPFDPVGLFCQRPQRRVDTAVSQGLSILAGLVLGGSLSAGAGSSTGRSSARDPEPDPDPDATQELGEGPDRG
jgi:hypothetical protein